MNVRFGVLSVINPKIGAKNLFDFLTDELKVTSFDLLFPHLTYDELSPYSMDGFAQFLCDVFDIWTLKDDKKIKIRFFISFLRQLLGGSIMNVAVKYHSKKTNRFFCLGEKVHMGQKIMTSLKELQGEVSISGNDAILQFTKLDNAPLIGFNVGNNNFVSMQQRVSTILASQKNLYNCRMKKNAIILMRKLIRA